MRDVLRDRRGATMVAMALGLAAFFALAVIGVDIARLAVTATEVQTLADATATAGAGALLNGGNVNAVANTVAGENTVDGNGAIVPCSGAAPCADLVTGTLNTNTFAFTPGGTPASAVESTAQATVHNVLAAILSTTFRTTTVTKTAIAGFGGLGGGQPTIPLALCDCAFPDDCNVNPLSCSLPVFTSPSCTTCTESNNAAWTSFTDSRTSTDTIKSFIPGGVPPEGCKGGGSVPAPYLTGDKPIFVTNGLGPYEELRCMACDLAPRRCTDADPCLAPVFDCTCPLGHPTGEQKLVGFAEVVIDSFHCSGGTGYECPCGTKVKGNVNGVSFHSIHKTGVAGPPGGGSFGVLVVQLAG